MPDGIIDMQDMGVIFSVTDLMGIHRESVSVELTKEDPGLINKSDRGIIEITIPETGTVEEFAQRLRSELEGLGYEEQEMDDEDEDCRAKTLDLLLQRGCGVFNRKVALRCRGRFQTCPYGCPAFCYCKKPLIPRRSPLKP